MSDTMLAALVLPTAFIAFIIAAAAWSRSRASSAGRALAALLLTLGIWDFAYGLHTAHVPAPDPRLWISIMYIGVATAPTALLVFALHFTHNQRWLTTPVRAALAVAPIAIIVAAWTDGAWGLLFSGATGADTKLRANAGPAFWVNIGYSYVMLAVATWILLRHRWSNRHSVYRRQLRGVLWGIALPWVSSLVFIVNGSPRDITPFAVSLAAFALGYAVLRCRMLEVAPIARDLLIERMADGVLVIDDLGVICDLNPMARRLLSIDERDAVGRHFTDCLQHQPALCALLRSGADARAEVPQSHAAGLVVDISTSSLDVRGHRVGLLALIRDVTERKRFEAELERRAGIDALTGIANRRNFEDLAAREMERRRRTGGPLSVVLIDVDNLKLVNDRGGHGAGDLALRQVASVLRRCARTTDVPARLGGDEFVLLLPDTTSEGARTVVQRIQRELRMITDADARTRELSVSAGIAAAVGAETIDATLKRADAALYAAKTGGRDRVLIAEVPAGTILDGGGSHV